MTKVIYAVNSKSQIEMLFSRKKYNLLMSYFYLAKRKDIKSFLQFIKSNLQEDSIFMLDSGAYSAWKSGVQVNLWELIEFVKLYHEYFSIIVCLDVIDNPILSEVNHRIMREELPEHLTIMPVFHSGEPFSVLDYMLERGYKAIGIAPNKNWTENQKREWFGQVFSKYTFEGVLTHGFGYQSLEGIQRFPLTTCDSTTWALHSAYGRVINPEISGLRYSNRTKGDVIHIDNVSGGHSQFVLDICSEIGVSVEELRSNYLALRLFNIEAISKLMEQEKIEIPVSVSIWDDEDYGTFNKNLLEDYYQKARAMGRNYTGDNL